MSDDKQLPVPRSSTVSDERRTYLTSPTQRSIIGRAVSRFMARLNTKTLDANTAELQALGRYVQEKGAVADAALDAERRIANYMYHRDDIIADDHEAHRDRMDENRHQRELNRRTREETIRAMDAATDRAAMQRGYDDRTAQANNEATLSQAEWEAASAKWGQEAFEQSMPFRKERIAHLYKEGALDKEIEMLITEASRDDLQRNRPGGSATGSNEAALATIDQLLSEVDKEIETARATHASDEELSVLYAFRSRLSSKRADLKRG